MNYTIVHVEFQTFWQNVNQTKAGGIPNDREQDKLMVPIEGKLCLIEDYYVVPRFLLPPPQHR
jgi:hypothetical protein